MDSPTMSTLTTGVVRDRLGHLCHESGDQSLQALADAVSRDGIDPHRDMLCTRLMENYKSTGSGAAYSLLFEIVAKQFLTIISNRLRKHYFLLDPQDVLQEVFFNIYRYPYRFKAEKAESFRNWANTIIRNTILKFARDKCRESRCQSMDDEMESHEDPRQRSPLGEAIQEESALMCARAYVLYLMLYADQYNRLSLKERQALHLVEVEGKSYKEVSEILNIKLENLKMVIFRARNKIVRNLERAMSISTPSLS